MIKKTICAVTCLVFFLSLAGPSVKAQTPNEVDEGILEAEVIEVVAQKETVKDNGTKTIQQNLKLKGLTGKYSGKEFLHEGISDQLVVTAAAYKKGDKVLVNWTVSPEGRIVFFVTDYIRRDNLYLLGIIFAAVVVALGGAKGIRSLISLGVSFLVIIKAVIPAIVAGANPILVAALGSFIILILIIYITDGVSRRSHIAVTSIFLCLLAVIGLSLTFTHLTRLTGFASEEAMFLLGLGQESINFQGLLLAGILIGTLGVLDDVVIGQIESVTQIKKANPRLSDIKVFTMAFDVGRAHMGAVVNTLFLAYTGAALPLLMLFSIQQSQFLSISQIINNEIIATEIVRTLVGSIGLALAIPITTYLAVKFHKEKRS